MEQLQRDIDFYGRQQPNKILDWHENHGDCEWGAISRRTAYWYKAYYDELKKTGEWENGSILGSVSK